MQVTKVKSSSEGWALIDELREWLYKKPHVMAMCKRPTPWQEHWDPFCIIYWTKI